MNDRILRYIDCEMSAEEAKLFEEDLKHDQVLAEEFKNFQAAQKAASLFIEAEIRGYLNDEVSRETKSEKAKSLWWIWLIGLLLIGATFWWTNTREKEAQRQTAPIQYAIGYLPPIWPIERGEQHLISEACSLHLYGKTDEAIAKLTANNHNMTDEMKYWAAEILVSVGRCKEGMTLIDMITQQDFEKERVFFMKKFCQD